MAFIDKIYTNEQGQLHRIDGPAAIHPDGRMEWFLNGKLHRTDGPAIIHGGNGGGKLWFVHGKQLTEEEFNAKKDWLDADLGGLVL